MKYEKTTDGWAIIATSNWDLALLDLLENSDTIQDFTHNRKEPARLEVGVEYLPDDPMDYLKALMEMFANELRYEAKYWDNYFTGEGRPNEYL